MQRGWHFLQIPGPSNTPERVLKAMSYPTVDHRGPEFGQLTLQLLEKTKHIFKTSGNVIIYPSSGTGAWEAALMNLFHTGDKILTYDTGHFSTLWKNLAIKIGIEVESIPGDWRRGVESQKIADHLRNDTNRDIKGVMVVHNETSTGVTSDIQAIRKAIDETGHPALLLVDVVSSLGTTDFNQDSWGVDVAICASQKGFMLPPGLGFNSINSKALEYAKSNKSLNSYWNWERIVEINQTGYYPYTPASNMLYGLNEAIDMLLEEGLDNVFNRHRRHAEATRLAAQAWGLENQCQIQSEYSDSTTALIVKEQKADHVRKISLEQLNMSLGTGLGKLKGELFRIGHLGDYNDLMLCATLSGVEMALELAKVDYTKGGVQAAMDYLTDNPQ